MNLAHTDVFTGMMDRTTLTDQNIACFGYLTSEDLNTQSLAFRFTAVLRTTNTFLMCHIFLI